MDIPEGDGDEPLSLAGRLRKVPEAIKRYVSTITRQYVGHVLGLVKSYWPSTRLDALGKGARAGTIPSICGGNFRSGQPDCGVPEQA